MELDPATLAAIRHYLDVAKADKDSVIADLPEELLVGLLKQNVLLLGVEGSPRREAFSSLVAAYDALWRNSPFKAQHEAELAKRRQAMN